VSPIADEAFVRGRTSLMALRDGSRVTIRPVLPVAGAEPARQGLTPNRD
jgi:hypothetical protein